MTINTLKTLGIMFIGALVATLFLLGLAKIAAAAFTYETGFENFNVGSISGQDNWQFTGNCTTQQYANIVDDNYFGTGKNLQIYCQGLGGKDAYAHRTIDPVYEADFTIKFSPADTMYISFQQGVLGSVFFVSLNVVDGIFKLRTAQRQVEIGYLPAGGKHDLNFVFADGKVKARYKPIASENWSEFSEEIPISTGTSYIDKIALYSSLGQPGSGLTYYDEIWESAPEPELELEFTNPLNSQSLPDFIRWGAKITPVESIAPSTLLITGYNCGEGVKYDWSLPSYTSIDSIRYWDFFKNQSLPLGSCSAKLFLHQTDSVYTASPDNLLAESEEISFTIISGAPYPTPSFPTPSPQFSTSSWEISEEYALQDYASSVPAIFGTTTPYQFYVSITSGFRNFIQPFAEFIIGIKSWLSNFIGEGYGDKARYLVAFASFNFNKIFEIPIIPIFSTYILFLIVFFIVKLIFKTLRG